MCVRVCVGGLCKRDRVRVIVCGERRGRGGGRGRGGLVLVCVYDSMIHVSIDFVCECFLCVYFFVVVP